MLLRRDGLWLAGYALLYAHVFMPTFHIASSSLPGRNAPSSAVLAFSFLFYYSFLFVFWWWWCCLAPSNPTVPCVYTPPRTGICGQGGLETSSCMQFGTVGILISIVHGKTVF